MKDGKSGVSCTQNTEPGRSCQKNFTNLSCIGYSSCTCTVNCFILHINSEAFKLSVICIQAPDPKAMQNTFESFCHSVVNKGDQIVHKLLGDQFKVCWQGSKFIVICLIM